MRKKVKAVPEWLNSPIWSTPPPAPAPADPFGADFSRPLAPPPEPPPSVPPPPTYEQAVGSYAGRDRETREEEGAGAAIRAHLLADFRAALSKKTVNMGELRRLACLGVPDGGSDVRPLVWKLLLGYLPTERSSWPYELEKKRSQYSAYKDEFLLNPSEKLRRIEESKLLRKKELNSERNGLLPRLEVTNEEHPLSFGKSSLWNQYFQESEILEQIDRDVKRTHPDMSFFSAKSNQASAEADTFFCFVELISGFKNNYCKHLDNSRVGIRSTLSKLSQLLKKHDEELWRHMEVITKVVRGGEPPEMAPRNWSNMRKRFTLSLRRKVELMFLTTLLLALPPGILSHQLK